ncbi:MAG: phage major capsid protein [Lachnospiraceae bacterium]|jgi:HK97 family phage major capsid protein|nr:phage major capsid protein [Lachnospiraceae bacterium]
MKRLDLQYFAVNEITRTDVNDLIPQPVSEEIIKAVANESAVFKMGKKLPNMTAKTYKMPVLNMLPVAYFVEGDTETKETTKAQWGNKIISAAELAVIVPIPEAVLDDSKYDIWAEIKPLLVEAFGAKIDAAILFGTDKPTDWRNGLVPSAVTAGAVVTETASVFDDIMGEAGVLSKVEGSGYDVNGHIASIAFKAKLRGLKDTTGRPLFGATLQDSNRYALDGSDIFFQKNGAFDTSAATLISGDFQQLVYAIRQDITFKIFDQGVVQDPATGDIAYNLMQNDMVALRAVMRLGWEIPNPVTTIGGANRFPFAVLAPAAQG